ncbi:hypothetical protein GGS24DRAFT_225781 [Hypoxylon argillaceum]|nr:hypothetical protein GGS24DRAFT_225781 [Hypoxylon argillaceum]
MKTVTMMPGWSAYRDQTVSLHVGGTKKNEQLLGHLVRGSKYSRGSLSSLKMKLMDVLVVLGSRRIVNGPSRFGRNRVHPAGHGSGNNWLDHHSFGLHGALRSEAYHWHAGRKQGVQIVRLPRCAGAYG